MRSPPRSGRGIVVARGSGIHGTGVFAVKKIRKGQPIVHYVGQLRTHKDVDDAYDASTDTGHTFYFTLNREYVVDAGIRGNVARWINHSCAPNCETSIEPDPGGDRRKDRILIEAIRDIEPGEELGYDYGITLDGPVTARDRVLWACHCGAPNCKGTMISERKRKRRGE